MGAVADAYAGCRLRIGVLVRGLGAEAASRPVAACPGWSVADVVSHLAGVVDDAVHGRLDGVTTAPWTAAQVEARRGRPLADVVEEWDEQAPHFESLLDAVGEAGHQAVTDVVTHEHDLRAALDAPDARTSDAVGIGVRFVALHVAEAARSLGHPLRVEVAGGPAVGPDDAAVVLRGERFELLRAMTGRRTADQLRRLAWEGDPEGVLAAFTYGPFRPPVEPVEGSTG